MGSRHNKNQKCPKTFNLRESCCELEKTHGNEESKKFQNVMSMTINKKIFLLNNIPEISYSDEIKAMKPIVLNGGISSIVNQTL